MTTGCADFSLLVQRLRNNIVRVTKLLREECIMKKGKFRLGLLAAAVVGAACFVTQPAKADFGLSIGGRRGGVSIYTGRSYYTPYYSSFGYYGVPTIRYSNYGYYGRPYYGGSYYVPHHRHYHNYGHHHHHHHGHHHHGHHHHW